jgi:hypothetical protein
VGTPISAGNVNFTVKENQMLIKVTKQRGNLPAGRIFMTEINYSTGDITVVPSFGTGTTKQVILNG